MARTMKTEKDAKPVADKLRFAVVHPRNALNQKVDILLLKVDPIVRPVCAERLSRV